MKLFSPRLNYLYAFLCVVIMFLVAYYLQHWKGIIPCPLCLLQRVTAGILGGFFFLGATLNLKKAGLWIVGFFSFIFSVLGALLAGRQIWLQHLPPSHNADCGASLEYMLNVLPLDQVLQKVLEGTTDCSRMEWSWLGMSLAEWSFVWFVIFAGFSIWQSLRRGPYDAKKLF